MVTLPFGNPVPLPQTVTGGQPVGASASTPRERRASTSGMIGRLRMCSSPSMMTAPSTSAAAAVRNRVAVPALPRKSGFSGCCKTPVPSTTKVVASGSVTLTPISRRASAI
ncbi:hypothetical protein D3C78_1082460 [compost metagenome]